MSALDDWHHYQANQRLSECLIASSILSRSANQQPHLDGVPLANTDHHPDFATINHLHTTSEMAQLVGLSNRSFAKYFNVLEQSLPCFYANNDLLLPKNLRHSDRSLADIAMTVGYRNYIALEHALNVPLAFHLANGANSIVSNTVDVLRKFPPIAYAAVTTPKAIPKVVDDT